METNPLITEKSLVQKRFTKAIFSYDENAIVQQQIHCCLIRLLHSTERTSFHRVLEIGCGTGGFTQKLTSYCFADEWVINDLCDAFVKNVADCFSDKFWKYVSGDAEQVTFPGTFDMVACASVIQWFHAPGEFIQKMISQLNHNGILLLNTFGRNNLKEVRTVTGKGLSYPSLEKIHRWVEPSCDILYLEEEEITLQFPTPVEVLQHLKHTGVTGTNKTGWTPSMLRAFCSEYMDRYCINNHVTLTYHPIYLLALKRLM